MNPRTDWVRCPICSEPDMRRETDAEGLSLIFCVNHSCPSNDVDRARADETRMQELELELERFEVLFKYASRFICHERGSGKVELRVSPERRYGLGMQTVRAVADGLLKAEAESDD